MTSTPRMVALLAALSALAAGCGSVGSPQDPEAGPLLSGPPGRAPEAIDDSSDGTVAPSVTATEGVVTEPSSGGVGATASTPHLDAVDGTYTIEVDEVFTYDFGIAGVVTPGDYVVDMVFSPAGATLEVDDAVHHGTWTWVPGWGDLGVHPVQLGLTQSGTGTVVDAVSLLLEVIPAQDLVEFGF